MLSLFSPKNFNKVRVRIAPSPTGDPHVGTAYMALFNYIFAKKFNGTFILRIEDTDQDRSRPEYEENIYKALHWTGLKWDEGPDVGGPYGPYRQSERTAIYQEYCQKLLDKGMAYKCFATADELIQMRKEAESKGLRVGYDRRYRNLSSEEVAKLEKEGRSYVVRLKIPLEGNCVYKDAVKGEITVPWIDVDDQILLKSDGFPTYHLANVVDDRLMEITHVIRGDEWMTSTPKHIFLYTAFGWDAPTFMHMPLLLGDDKTKLSKRKNPTSIFFFRDSGYLPEAMCNFLALMGYSAPDGKEIHTIDGLIKDFDPSRIGVSGAVFDIKKLDAINQHYIINKLEPKELWQRIKEWSFNDAFMEKLMVSAHPRIKTFGDFMDLFHFLFVNHLSYSEELLIPKESTKEQVKLLIQTFIFALEGGDWCSRALEKASTDVAIHFNVDYKKVVIPILYGALTGKRFGPPLFDKENGGIAEFLGKDRMRARFLQSIEFLGKLSNKAREALKKEWEAKH